MSSWKPSISFVIPCLNEGKTLSLILDRIKRVCNEDFGDRETEIIVSDNGSTDNSVSLAKEKGSRVVHCEERGYGAALLCGIHHAKHEVIIFADADNTYDFGESPSLITELEKGFDLVIGSRLEGEIHRGAMPFLHRHLGTPVLNMFINFLYTKGNGKKITDCNSGFRCFRRSQFMAWDIQSKGMEFASEMLVKALKSNAKFSQVPISLYPDVGERVPHLKTWRDGMRHALQIFLESPGFFHYLGLIVFFLSWGFLLIGVFFGPIKVGFASIFGLHTMMFSYMSSTFGLIIWAMGLYLSVSVPKKRLSYGYLIELPEDRLFWCTVGLVFICSAMFTGIFVKWAINGFDILELEKETLATIAFASNCMVFVFSLNTVHLLKRS